MTPNCQMNTTEKFCLKWNDFQGNITATFGSLRSDTDFADVTLTCEDGEQIEAHKVILAASSPFFQDLLKRTKHAHPLIYMRGMKSEDLVAIVDFLYYGEANIYQNNLDSFLVIAEELKLKGLTGNTHNTQKYEGHELVHQKTEFIKSEDPPQTTHHVIEMPNSNISKPNQIVNYASHNTVAIGDHKVSVDLEDLDEQIKSMIKFGDPIMTGSHAGRKTNICCVCGKEGMLTNIRDHIEAHHIKGLSHPCNFCDKTFRSRVSLRMHKKSNHRN